MDRKKCKVCLDQKPVKRFRLPRLTCMDCENAQRRRYYRAKARACTRRSAVANKTWRNRSLKNREQTREWNRISYWRRKAAGVPRKQLRRSRS